MTIIEKTYSFTSSMTNRSSTKRIILHHAAATSCTADTIHGWHLGNGWAGIGYHFFISRDGSIYRGRPENKVGSHAAGSNSDSLGICFEGNYEAQTMPLVQENAGIELVSYLKNKYGITKVQKHSDVYATACPGKNFPFNSIANGTVSAENKTPQTEDPKGEFDNVNKSQFIKELYLIVMGREADADGLSYWVKQIEEKGTFLDIYTAFTDSEEGRINYIKMLYQNFLGRGADEAGLQYHLERLRNGASREDIYNDIINSSEYKSK